MNGSNVGKSPKISATFIVAEVAKIFGSFFQIIWPKFSANSATGVPKLPGEFRYGKVRYNYSA